MRYFYRSNKLAYRYKLYFRVTVIILKVAYVETDGKEMNVPNVLLNMDVKTDTVLSRLNAYADRDIKGSFVILRWT